MAKIILCAGIDADIMTGLQNYYADAFDFLTLDSAQALMDAIRAFRASLIMLSTDLPDCGSIQELSIALRSHNNTETVPLFIITNTGPDQKEKIKLFQAGLIDGYFAMPINIEELAAYASVFLQRQALQEELEEKNLLLSKMSITDELMQIFNRRYLMHRLDDELERIKRYDYPLSILMLDIDFFKNINDKFGHIQGDNALRGLGLLLKKNIRAMDILCRYGGEEIVIILPHMNAKGSLLTAERLRTKVCETDFGTIEIPLKFTISIGLVTLEETADIGIDGLFQLLDQQLYKAKNSGRNQVSAAVFRNNTAV